MDRFHCAKEIRYKSVMLRGCADYVMHGYMDALHANYIIQNLFRRLLDNLPVYGGEELRLEQYRLLCESKKH